VLTADCYLLIAICFYNDFHVLPPIDKLFSLIDFLGVGVGALGGALAAVRDTRYRYDLVGVLGLALASALGGGITRDIILQQGPPLVFTDARYLLTALAGGLLGLAVSSQVFTSQSFSSRFESSHLSSGAGRVIVVVDAAALGLFAVAGSTRALNAHLGLLPALLLGGVTAVGGGSIRDVLSGRTPKIFERGEFYAIAAAFGSAAFLACDALHLNRSASTLVGTLCGFVLRILSLRYHWQTRSVRGES
jgi:uncharacterized membrane protein YeiH